jgi:putative protease
LQLKNGRGTNEEKDKMNMPKILSPVTSYSGAQQVIAAGADEIYCAVEIPNAMHVLNRMSFCCVPTYEELGRIAKEARSKGVETVVTLELPFMSQFMVEQMKEHISVCINEGTNALIVTDIGLIRLIREDMGLDIPIYASTWLGAMNYEAIDFLRDIGVQRVVLTRHVSMEEISDIVRRHSDVEIEVFVHGVGCSNINANCYIDPIAGPPDAMMSVVGAIKAPASPCRASFDIYELGRGKQKMASVPILDAYTYCSLCRLPELIETGVTGLKIVGRCLPVSYQVQVTRMYRDLVDLVEEGSRAGWTQAQRDRLDRMIDSFKDGPFLPQSRERSPDSGLERLRDNLCRERRCYYTSFFHVPYRSSESQPQESGG